MLLSCILLAWPRRPAVPAVDHQLLHSLISPAGLAGICYHSITLQTTRPLSPHPLCPPRTAPCPPPLPPPTAPTPTPPCAAAWPTPR
jgi:hypothetical protein